MHLLLGGGEQFKPEFQKINPAAQVPVLLIDGASLCESVAILEYLEETRPEPALLPVEPARRAKVRQIVEMVNAGIQPKQNLSIGTWVSHNYGGVEERKRWNAHWITKGFEALEVVFAESSGKCCVGDTVTFADCVLVPQAYSAARFGVDTRDFPKLHAIYQHLSGLPEFEAAHPSVQPDAQ